MNIWIVQGSSGQYDDYWAWAHKAFYSYEAAQAWIDRQSEGNLQALSFESVSKRIIMNLLNDRQAILMENKAMSSYLKKIGHYTAEALGIKE